MLYNSLNTGAGFLAVVEVKPVFTMRPFLHLVVILIRSLCLHGEKFLDHFSFGTASSAYQIEGAWNTDGKGNNIWDIFTHNNSQHIQDHSNGDISSDSYHNIAGDVLRLKNLGVDFYVFSLSWSRILPKGILLDINAEAIHYYNTLINSLIREGITPIISLFHWDTPQPIEELGGFTNSAIVEWYEEYAKVVFENYGNRIKYWLTFNDPKEMCLRGYGGTNAAPGYNLSGIADYMCAHNVLMAHARVYHMYNNIYKPMYKGKVSIGLGSNWYEPATTSSEDIQASKRALDFSLGWFADPIYHPLGMYPKSMHNEIESRSEKEGFTTSRLPQFNKDDAKYIRGTHDFFALNHFTTEMVMADLNEGPFKKPSYAKDRRVQLHRLSTSSNISSSDLKIESQGFEKLLKHIKYRYQNPQIIVTGNGFADTGGVNDVDRVRYLEQYLSSLLDAIRVGEVNVVGYAVWSFMDGFEWENGYTMKYGLYHVDFTTPNRTRSLKTSARYYKDVVTNKMLIFTGKSTSSTTSSFILKYVLLIACLVIFK